MTTAVTCPDAPPAPTGNFALRFFGNGTGDIDRVKISIDAPPRPADIGATDFTLEFWMKANLADNNTSACTTGADNWITGNIIFDRDVFGNGDFGDYGISIRGGQLAFGTHNGSVGLGICGATNVADGQWHHVAVTRRLSDGQLTIYVDGIQDGQGSGAPGDISYRDGRPTSFPNDPFLVLGAEKHDIDRTSFPSYNGFLDEVRLSNTIRYTVNFARPTQPFTADQNTVALYHLDEGAGNTITDSSNAAGGPSNGTRNFGGSPAGPEWVSDTPFTNPTPGTAAPSFSMTSPLNYPTVSGTITVTAGASDDVGVAGVQFLLDGVNLGTKNFSAHGVVPGTLTETYSLAGTGPNNDTRTGTFRASFAGTDPPGTCSNQSLALTGTRRRVGK